MALSSSIFQVIIAVRPITLVMSKISSGIKLGSTHCGNLFLDTEQLLQNFRKRVGSYAQWKQSVNGLMSVGQQRNESHGAVSRKRRKQHE